MGCYIWYSDEGTGRGRSLPKPLLAVPNVTAHCPPINSQCTNHRIAVLVVCGFNVPIKGLPYGRWQTGGRADASTVAVAIDAIPRPA